MVPISIKTLKVKYSVQGQFWTLFEISLSRKIEMTNTKKFELKR